MLSTDPLEKGDIGPHGQPGSIPGFRSTVILDQPPNPSDLYLSPFWGCVTMAMRGADAHGSALCRCSPGLLWTGLISYRSSEQDRSN